MGKIQVAFIGAGDISILHAEGIRSCPGASLKGLWNITDDLAQEKSQKFACMIYPSVEALLADPEIDAVFVLTNYETHHYYVMKALEAGKHVFVEKPVGLNLKEIEDMRSKATQMGLICVPGHNYIYEPSIQRAKALLDAGRLGDLVSLNIQFNIHHPEEAAAKYPGVVRQILMHHAYITLYLVGMPVKVSAMKAHLHYEKLEVEDLAMANLTLASGALAHFTASFAADDHAGDPWTMMVKLIGTKGSTRFSYRDWVENNPGMIHAQTYSAYPYSIEEIDRYFVEECLGKGKKPLSTMEHAIQAQQIIEAIERSIEEERHVYV